MKIRLPGLQDFFILIVAIGLVASQFTELAKDPGLGWHLKSGEIIADTITLPATDPFLAYTVERPWLLDQWLGSLIFYSLYSTGGWALSYAFAFSAFLCLYMLILYRGLTASGIPFFAASLTSVLVCKLSQLHFVLRPTMLGFIFFTVLAVLFLTLYEKTAAERCRYYLQKKWHILIPLLFLVWANIHPTFVLGLFLLLCAPLSFCIERYLLGIRDEAETRFARVIAVTLCVAVLATFINPYGPRLHLSILKLGSNEYFMNYFQEWSSPDFKQFEGLLTLLFIAVPFLALLASRKFYVRVTVFQAISFFVFLCLGLRAIRMLPYFAIASAPVFAHALSAVGDTALINRTATGKRLSLLVARLNAFEARSARGSVALVLLILCVTSSAFFYGRIPLYSQELGPPRDQYPYEVLAHLLETPGKKTVVSIPEWGGFITLMGEGRLAPVIDDRAGLLGESFFRNHFDSLRIQGDWESYLSKLEASHLLLPHTSPLGSHLLETGKLPLILKTKVALLFEVT